MSTLTTEEIGERFQAVMLTAHLKLLERGFKNSRLSGTQILTKAGALTGKTYKRGQYRQAIDDLTAWIEARS